MNLLISYKNGQSDVFEEKQLDCSVSTIKGHASTLIEALEKNQKGIHKIDRYNAVLLDEVICVRVA